MCRIPYSCLPSNACAVQWLIAVSLGTTSLVPAQAFVRRLTCRCKVTGFATGNLDSHGVKSLAADVEAMLKVHPRAPEILGCCMTDDWHDWHSHPDKATKHLTLIMHHGIVMALCARA